MILNENNKQEYPSMNTGKTDTSLRCKNFISTLFFALIMWCSPCQSCHAQTPDFVDWARNDTDIQQVRIAQNQGYYVYILALDNKIIQGGRISFDEACRAIPKSADEILVLWGNNETEGTYRGRRIDQKCFNYAMNNPGSDIIGRYFTAAYHANGHYGEIYKTDCYLIWKRHPQQTTAILSRLFDKETADYFIEMFEEWSKREIDNKQKIQRSSLWETNTQHIVGSVVDATNNKPIENAKLELLRKDDSSFVCSTTTNSEGKYGLSFPQLTHNDGSLVLFILRITADGYQSLCIGVDMSMIIECQSIYPHIPSIFPLKPIDKEVPYKKTKGTEQRR